MATTDGHAERAEAIEARSGLDPWKVAELPEPPRPKGLGWFSAVGPAVIVLGVSIGSGEFLLGPAGFVRYGISLLWVTIVAITLQTFFNFELMRYTLATGEPAFTGFMRTKPSSTFWGWVYTILYFGQVGWPAWAGTAAGAMFFLGENRIAGAGDAGNVYLIGVAMYLVCVVILLVGRRIERTLEILNWFLITVVIGGMFILAVMLVPGSVWLDAGAGIFGYDRSLGRFAFLPAGADFFLLGALVAFSGAGGVANLTLSNWARDKGYGMGERAGFIPAAVGGKKVNLAHSGFMFKPTPDAMRRWEGWWRIVRVDQWGVFFTGAILGMVLPAILYVAFIDRGTDIRGLGIAAALASNVGASAGVVLGSAVAALGAWLLFKTQLDILDGTVRSVTDILWTGNKRIRSWRGGDVRAVYYGVLLVVVAWGVIALRLAQPIILLQIGANVAGVILVISSVHLLYVNTKFLPVELRPPMWRRAILVILCLFYLFFVVLSARALLF